MKLAEALMERSDLVKKLKSLEEEIESSIFTTDKEEIEIQNTYLKDKIEAFETISIRLYKFNVEIDKANVGIQHYIKFLQKIDRLISFYSSIRKEILSKNDFFGHRDTIRYACLDIDYVNQNIEYLGQERRIVDKKIQKYNWETEVEVEIDV